MIKKPYFETLVAASLMAAFVDDPGVVKAEDGSTHEAKSDIFIKPASGLDFKPDRDMPRKEEAAIFSSNHFPLSNTADIGFLFGRPHKQDTTDKKLSTDKQALFGFIFRF